MRRCLRVTSAVTRALFLWYLVLAFIANAGRRMRGWRYTAATITVAMHLLTVLGNRAYARLVQLMPGGTLPSVQQVNARVGINATPRIDGFHIFMPARALAYYLVATARASGLGVVRAPPCLWPRPLA